MCKIKYSIVVTIQRNNICILISPTFYGRDSALHLYDFFFLMQDTTAYKIELLIISLFDCVYISSFLF